METQNRRASTRVFISLKPKPNHLCSFAEGFMTVYPGLVRVYGVSKGLMPASQSPVQGHRPQTVGGSARRWFRMAFACSSACAAQSSDLFPQVLSSRADRVSCKLVAPLAHRPKIQVHARAPPDAPWLSLFSGFNMLNVSGVHKAAPTQHREGGRGAPSCRSHARN